MYLWCGGFGMIGRQLRPPGYPDRRGRCNHAGEIWVFEAASGQVGKWAGIGPVFQNRVVK